MGPDGRPQGAQRPEQARVFFALWPDDPVRAALHRAAVDGARRFGGRAMQIETLHLTLAFLGDVPMADLGVLHGAAAGVQSQAFHLHLDRLGFWGHNRILWAGSQAAAAGLAALAEDLAGQLQSAGYSSGIKTGRPFAPHITLVRNVEARRPELPGLPAIGWACEHFVLVRSHLSAKGASYEILGRWPLR